MNSVRKRLQKKRILIWTLSLVSMQPIKVHMQWSKPTSLPDRTLRNPVCCLHRIVHHADWAFISDCSINTFTHLASVYMSIYRQIVLPYALLSTLSIFQSSTYIRKTVWSYGKNTQFWLVCKQFYNGSLWENFVSSVRIFCSKSMTKNVLKDNHYKTNQSEVSALPARSGRNEQKNSLSFSVVGLYRYTDRHRLDSIISLWSIQKHE